MTSSISALPVRVASESGLFDSITGLPMHPLVVHAAVVLLPLAELGVIAIVLLPRLRRAYGWPVILLTLLAAAATFVAKESGEALAHRIGEPQEHAEWGDRLFAITGLFTLLTLAWWLFARRRGVEGAHRTGQTLRSGDEHLQVTRSPGTDGATAATGVAGSAQGARGDSVLARILGALAALGAVASLVAVVLTGHSGAVATWSGTDSSSGDSAETTSSSSATSSSSPTSSTSAASTGSTGSSAGAAAAAGASTGASGSTSASGVGRYTLAQVKQHNSATSCWTAINGSVYDVTSWISRHPGGTSPIEGLCGTDGTAAFTAKHGGEARPASELAGFKIGTLG